VTIDAPGVDVDLTQLTLADGAGAPFELDVDGYGAEEGGGGLHCAHSANVLGSSLRFMDSSASFGAGALATGGCALELVSVSFEGNSADWGAIFVAPDSTLGLYDAQLLENTGGALSAWRSTVVVEDSLFQDNSADSGAAIDGWDADVTARDTELLDNRSEYAGAVLAQEARVTLEDVVFEGNSVACETPGDDLCAGGALAALDGATVSVLRGELSDNSAHGGGALYAESSTLSLEGVTVRENTAVTDADSSYGGGVLAEGGSLSFTGVDIEENTVGGKAPVAAEGGGLHLTDMITVFDDVRLIANAAATDGGGMYLHEVLGAFEDVRLLGNSAEGANLGTRASTSDLSFTDAGFASNSPDDADVGGTSYTWDATLSLTCDGDGCTE